MSGVRLAKIKLKFGTKCHYSLKLIPVVDGQRKFFKSKSTVRYSQPEMTVARHWQALVAYKITS